MSVTLNHTIVHVRDKVSSARFYAEILGVPEAEPFSVLRDQLQSTRARSLAHPHPADTNLHDYPSACVSTPASAVPQASLAAGSTHSRASLSRIGVSSASSSGGGHNITISLTPASR